MTRRHTTLAWAAAAATYLLIVLGGVVRITGSGMGCGDHWPLCNGRLIPPLDDPATLIEWGHRLLATPVSILVFGLAGYSWWLTRGAGSGERSLKSPAGSGERPLKSPAGSGERPLKSPAGSGERFAPLRRRAAYLAAVLLVVQILLGAVTVKLELPHWTVVLHLATAMLILAALLVAATGRQPLTAPGIALVALGLALATVLLGALTAKLGAGTACLGFPLCNDQLWPAGNYLQHTHWTHRLLAYGFAGWAAWWAWRAPAPGTRAVLALVLAQLGVAAAMVLLDLPLAWRAAHVAVGTAAWGATVLAAR